jgi:type IV secretory pathway protease TraF
MGKLVALVVIALITSFILFGHRLLVNRTHSLPVGLYYWSDVPIKKESIVLFEPDQSTPLPNQVVADGRIGTGQAIAAETPGKARRPARDFESAVVRLD